MRSGSRHGRQVHGRWKSPTATDSEVAPQAVEEARFGLGNGAALSYEFRVIDSAGRDSHLDLPLVDRKAMIRWGRAWRMWPVI
jgi:hypothetical protein